MWQTFLGRERDYLAAMCNQRLDKVDDLLALLKPESGVDHSQVDLTFMSSSDDGQSEAGHPKPGTLGLADSVWDTTYEADFMLALEHYLRQRGHPDTRVIKEMVGDEWQEQAGNALLRARLFLTMMSGSDLKPIEAHLKIKVSLLSARTWSWLSVPLRRLPSSTPVFATGKAGVRSTPYQLRCVCLQVLSILMSDALTNSLTFTPASMNVP